MPILCLKGENMIRADDWVPTIIPYIEEGLTVKIVPQGFSMVPFITGGRDEVNLVKISDDLKRGDIVWVEFGINVGTELSDHQTKGHYAIVWAVDLGNVIVIPLSSRPAPGSCLTYDVGVIDGLVQEGVNYRSYLKLDAIRSVSKRRIGRMPGKNGGKVTIDEKLLITIQNIIKKNLVD